MDVQQHVTIMGILDYGLRREPDLDVCVQNALGA